MRCVFIAIMNMDFEAIVDGCRRRDHRSQKALYDAFAPMMFGVCIRYMGSREEAQDVLQDAFVKVFERIHTLREPQAVEDWVYHVVVRTAMNALRKKKSKREDLVGQEEAFEISYDPYGAEHIVEAVACLPVAYRTVFNLREVEGYEFAEISEMMDGVSENTLRTMLYRARRKLKSTLLGNVK